MFLLREGLAVVVITLFDIILVDFFLFGDQFLQPSLKVYVFRELLFSEKIILRFPLFQELIDYSLSNILRRVQILRWPEITA